MSVGPLPKYLAISQEIETRLRAGAWGDGKLPSARQVAAAHQVSVVTAARALQVLRDKDLIRTVERSGNYPAAADGPSAAPATWALVLRSTAGPFQQASIAATVAGFAAEAKARGVRIAGDAFEVRDRLAPADLRRQARRASSAGVSGVFFMPTRINAELARQDEAFLDACRGAGLAVVLVERNLRGRWRPLAADLVATDDLDGGYRCTAHLVSIGRRRVAFATGSPTSSHEGRVAGYLAALQHADGPEPSAPRAPLILEQRAGAPSKASYVELADQVLRHEVDAVACYSDYTAVGLIIELLTRGLSVPRDVAITGFDDVPIGNSFALGVTTYAFPARAVAREACLLMSRRLEDPSPPWIKVLVPGTLILRESSVEGGVAAPPSP